MRKSIKLEPDTKKIVTDQEKIKRLTEHDGWPIVRALFLKKAAEMVNISDINIVNPLSGNLVAEIGMRQLASARLLEIIRDVEGTAQQYDANSALTEQLDSTFIIRR